jgi:putative DNA methylase
MTSYRKKLIEVALPLKAINEASAREKSIRHGHPSTLHLWWARRPLAACRAVLFASLVDDPESDPEFRLLAEEVRGKKRADLFNLIEELVQWENSNNPEVIRSARAEIARCVASRLIETGKLTHDQVIAEGMTVGLFTTSCHCHCIPGGFDDKAGRVRYRFETRGLPPAAVVNNFLAEYGPPVLDPFCGGGSIPLEAQRLGLRAYASDLNPVPVLITKALIEIPPKFAGRPPVNPEWQAKPQVEKAARFWQRAQGLAEDVRYYGRWMRDEAEKRIGHLYPKVKITKEMAKDRPDLQKYVGQELKVIAWIWARTVASPNPAWPGIHVPLVKSFWLSQKKGKKAWLETVIDRKSSQYRFVVQKGEGGPNLKGTVDRKGGCCIVSGSPISFDYIRTAGKEGQLGCRLLAIVAEGLRERVYLAPIPEHESLADSVQPPESVPDTQMAFNPFSLRPPLYGLSSFADIFSPRQLVALVTFSDLITELDRIVASDAVRAGIAANNRTLGDGGFAAEAYANSICTYLMFAVDKGANYWSAMCAWSTTTEKMVSTFGRQAIPMIWDFAEANPFSESSGNFSLGVEQAANLLDQSMADREGVVNQHDAARPYTMINSPIVSTDPPYYNNIDYADLSDFFYAWLRRSLKPFFPKLFSTVAVPKDAEIVASPYRFNGDKEEANRFFEKTLRQAFLQMNNAQNKEYPLSVFYAFKQAESDEAQSDAIDATETVVSTGWETMLEGLIASGFTLSGTWPMRTELTGNLKGHMNVLASSVVLVASGVPHEKWTLS